MAPSTLGTFLRAFTFGHVRQLEAVVDVEAGCASGAAFGYTKVLGLHPLLATRADTGEVLHARLRKGSANTRRGAKRFVEELVARLLGPEATLWPDWRYLAFLTDLTASAVEVDTFHRQRAQAELDIRDLKEGAGMDGALPIGQLRCQRRLALLRRPGPQPGSLDPGLGRSPRPRRPPSDRRSDHPHALRLAARSDRQPLGDPDVACTEPLAVAGAIHRRPFERARPRPRRRRHLSPVSAVD
jgi:hypothetical protein